MDISVSCVQMHPRLNAFEDNINTMCRLIDKTMSLYPKTQLIVFPELATTGYECDERFQEFAEVLDEPDQPSLVRIGESAAKHNVYIIYGLPQRAVKNEPLLYNSAVMLDNKGIVVGAYQKAQLFDAEKKWFATGSNYPVFDTPMGKIGIFICFDTFFPEIARIEALKGADLFAVCTNWEKPYEYDLELAMSSRAMDNVTYLACANRIGFDKTLGFFGYSRILDPKGKPIATLNDEAEGIINAELDYQIARDLKRDYYTFFQDRKPETYDELCRR